MSLLSLKVFNQRLKGSWNEGRKFGQANPQLWVSQRTGFLVSARHCIRSRGRRCGWDFHLRLLAVSKYWSCFHTLQLFRMHFSHTGNHTPVVWANPNAKMSGEQVSPPLLRQTRDFQTRFPKPKIVSVKNCTSFSPKISWYYNRLHRTLANAYYASSAHSVICLSSVKAIETVLVSAFLSYEPEPLWIRTKK